MATTLERKGLQGRQPVTLPKHFIPRFWEDSDGRCAVVKTILRRYHRIKADAGGGESYQRDLLCQRVAFISIILETQEVKAAEGTGEFDLGVYTQATNALTGLLKTLGLDKRLKNVSDLRSYLDQQKAE